MATSCCVVVRPNLPCGGTPRPRIENVATHAGYRNRGFGKVVLKAAVERAWREGCYEMMLMTGSKTASTLEFHEAAGFEQAKTGFQIRRLPLRADRQCATNRRCRIVARTIEQRSRSCCDAALTARPSGGNQNKGGYQIFGKYQDPVLKIGSLPRIAHRSSAIRRLWSEGADSSGELRSGDGSRFFTIGY